MNKKIKFYTKQNEIITITMEIDELSLSRQLQNNKFFVVKENKTTTLINLDNVYKIEYYDEKLIEKENFINIILQ